MEKSPKDFVVVTSLSVVSNSLKAKSLGSEVIFSLKSNNSSSLHSKDLSYTVKWPS